MGFFDSLKGIGKNTGPENWEQRTKDSISFTSPSGKIFNCLWIKDERDKNKRLQVTEFIGSKFSKVKDHGMSSPNHPISFYFYGTDCDLDAQKFWDASDEEGQWEVIHPIHNFKSYQLVSVKQYNDPVDNGGCVYFDTVWIEPKNKEAKDSKRKLSSMAEHSRKNLDENSALSFAEKLQLTEEAYKKGCENFSKKISNISSKILGPVAACSDLAFKTFLDTKRMLNNIRSSTLLSALSLAGQFQQLIGIAARSTKDVSRRNMAYNDLIKSLLNQNKELKDYNSILTDDTDLINRSAIMELVLISSISGLCETAYTSDIKTNDQTIEIVDNILKQTESIIKSLEDIQVLLSNNNINNNFIAVENYFPYLEDLIYNTINYVMYSNTRAGVVKSIIIDSPVSTIVFYVQHYNTTLGFEDFCDMNGFDGDEILFLPFGKEVFV